MYITGGVAVKRWTSHPNNNNISPLNSSSNSSINIFSLSFLFRSSNNHSRDHHHHLYLNPLFFFFFFFFSFAYKTAQHIWRRAHWWLWPGSSFPFCILILQWGLYKCERLLKRSSTRQHIGGIWYEMGLEENQKLTGPINTSDPHSFIWRREMGEILDRLFFLLLFCGERDRKRESEVARVVKM